MKRFNSIEHLNTITDSIDLLITSNITTSNNKMMIFDYSSYLNENQCIVDNSGLMCINLIKRIGKKKIILMGFDGYSTNGISSYYDNNLSYPMGLEE